MMKEKLSELYFFLVYQAKWRSEKIKIEWDERDVFFVRKECVMIIILCIFDLSSLFTQFIKKPGNI